MPPHLPHRAIWLSLALCAAACASPTAPTPLDIAAHHAMWQARGPATYSYEYEQTGFFNNLSNHVMRVQVRNDTVQSAVYVDTGDTIPSAAAFVPTIESLFAAANSARSAGTLSGITFDPVLGYPTRIDIAGPPDAGGSLFAALVQ